MGTLCWNRGTSLLREDKNEFSLVLGFGKEMEAGPEKCKVCKMVVIRLKFSCSKMIKYLTNVRELDLFWGIFFSSPAQ